MENRSDICAHAELPVRRWHALRHSFGTHAAQYGINPWRLMAWMGHKQIDQTMRYVHVAEGHARPLPEHVRAAADRETDPDRRVLAMLGARGEFSEILPKSGEKQAKYL